MSLREGTELVLVCAHSGKDLRALYSASLLAKVKGDEEMIP